jgi:CheY-like chemotaxis protein
MDTNQGASTNRLRVLVADDDPDMLFLITTSLELDRRFTVVGTCGDGEEAVRLAATLQPDLVVLDEQMPLLSGVEALRRIRQDAPDLIVVLYTAYVSNAVAYGALVAGAAAVLEKTASPTALCAELARLATSAQPTELVLST